MPGPRFARLAVLLPAYRGAVAAAFVHNAPAEPSPSPSPLMPVPSGPPTDVILGTQTAIALSPHSDLFEFGA